MKRFDLSGATVEDIDSLYRAFLPHNDTTPVARSLDGDRVYFGPWIFENNPLGVPPEPSMQDHSSRFFAWIPGVRKWDYAYFLKRHYALQKALTTPYNGEIRHREYNILTRIRDRVLLTEALVPDVYRVKMHTLENLAQARIVLSGLQLIREYIENGRFPNDLPEGPNQQSSDPYVAHPLIYERSEAGFQLWSMGKNRRDLAEQTRMGLKWVYPPAAPLMRAPVE